MITSDSISSVKGHAGWTNLDGGDLQGCPSLTSFARAKECHEHFADRERKTGKETAIVLCLLRPAMIRN